MNKIEVFNETKEKINLKSLECLSDFVLKKENVHDGIINIILVDDDYIHNINKEYRGIDRVTDVISFALEDNENLSFEFGRLLGDIYICIPQMKRQALEYGHSEKRELSFLIVHGILHLLGYDHMKKEEEKIMFDKQELILSEYGIER
jgi:probable rRNA maturation factor